MISIIFYLYYDEKLKLQLTYFNVKYLSLKLNKLILLHMQIKFLLLISELDFRQFGLNKEY